MLGFKSLLTETSTFYQNQNGPHVSLFTCILNIYLHCLNVAGCSVLTQINIYKILQNYAYLRIYIICFSKLSGLYRGSLLVLLVYAGEV